MLIATAAAAVLVATSFAAGAVAPIPQPAPPPIVVNLSVADNVPPSIVAHAIGEAEAIFKSAGISFIWRYGPPSLTTLTVAIGNGRGAPHDGVMPLGWIVFEDGRPDQQIYLSYANAEEFLVDARSVVGTVANMPRAERETMLARALGRALAHELGHYLLDTSRHSPAGLLRQTMAAREMQQPNPAHLRLSRKELQMMCRRPGTSVPQ
jgi:hypothetical protein